jgi:hypothetical protein
MKRSFRRWLAGGLAVMGLALFAGTATSAAESGEPAPLPPGCPEGAAALQGVRFDDGGPPVGELSQLTLGSGETLTVRWDRFAPGCADASGTPLIQVSLAAYATTALTFDPVVDQTLVASTTCGLGGASCAVTEGGYALRLTVPPESVGCRFQIDAILGEPLPIVGPSGSYYSAVLRGGGPSLLIGAVSVDIPGCVPAVAPVAPPAAPPTIPPTSPPTTAAPASATPVVVATTAEVLAAGAAQATLPVTGADPAPVAGAGAGLVVGGVALFSLSALVAAHRPATAAGPASGPVAGRRGAC